MNAATHTMQSRPLEGLRILDLTRALAGPYATMLLAGLGAEVIKIEDPVGGDLARENSPYVGRQGIVRERQFDDDVSISHLTRARGKYGVTLNLKSAEGVKLFRDLVKVSDIVVENFTSGTADRLGVGYAAAQSINERIVYCSLSGFGATGDGQGKAMDVIIQALSGAMYTSGDEDEPPIRIGIPIADMLAPLFGVIGILAAIERRHVTGKGQWVDVSMLGALTSFVAIENWRAMQAVGMVGRSGLTVQRLSPFGVFHCRDGYVSIVAVHDQLSQGLFRAMGREDLGVDARFATRDARVSNAVALEALINEWSGGLPVTAVLAALEREGVPAAPVRHPAEALNDPRVVARGETVAVKHPTYGTDLELQSAGVPIVFSDGRTGFDEVVPIRLGEHNERVFEDLLGLSQDQIQALHAKGVL